MTGADRKLARRDRRRQPTNGAARRRATPRGSQYAGRVIPNDMTNAGVFPACEAGGDGRVPAITAMCDGTSKRVVSAQRDRMRDAASGGTRRCRAHRDSPMKNVMKSCARCVQGNTVS
jgi:hypothetical protein